MEANRSVERVLVMGTGHMAAHCPGKLGDGLILGALASWLHAKGREVHLVTNPVVYPYLRATYSYGMTQVEDDFKIWKEHRSLLAWADGLIIPKPGGDRAVGWLIGQALGSGKLNPSAVLHMKNLEAYNGTEHIMQQLTRQVVAFLWDVSPDKTRVGLADTGTSLKADPGGLLPRAYHSLDQVHELYDQRIPENLILPVAGDYNKALSTPQCQEAVDCLRPHILFAGTLFGRDHDQIGRLRWSLNRIEPHQLMCLSMAALFEAAIHAKRIISADSGLLWLVTGFLNDRVLRGGLSESTYPEIIVVHQGHQARVPAFEIWHPLLAYPGKLKVAGSSGQSLQDVL